MIKYIGSKRKLVPTILGLVNQLQDVSSVIDLFSGTSRVGHALKASGYQVFSNDHNAYAATLARCYVQSDAEDHLAAARALIADLNAVPGEAGWFTQTYCEDSRFFQPHNGARIDAIRDAIAALELEPELEAIALVSLMEAADRVDSTTGVQMAYLKSWARRSHNDLSMRVPALLDRAPAGKGGATQLDALAAARCLSADLAYLDPPYNQHKYVGNYHAWETLVRWDQPDVYGIARKRIDCRERKSPYNSRPRIRAAMAGLIAEVDAPNLLVSFSDEGFLDRAELVEMLSTRGVVQVLARDHDRYVGARIGVYNPAGVRVGKVSHLRNKELLFLVTPEPVQIDAAALP
jgi:adenine-specific DNA-methyltransferase